MAPEMLPEEIMHLPDPSWGTCDVQIVKYAKSFSLSSSSACVQSKLGPALRQLAIVLVEHSHGGLTVVTRLVVSSRV